MSLRLVVFGHMGPDAALLDDREVRACLRAVLSPQGMGAAAPSPRAVAAGLVTAQGRAGERLLAVDPQPWLPELDAAASAVAAHVMRRLRGLRRAAAGAVHDPDWTRDRALVIGGLLLDVAVGERLRRDGHCLAADASWRLWSLPPVDVTMGFQGNHRDGAGAGVLWVQGLPLPGLPSEAEHPWLAEPAAAPATVRLGLRMRGWLRGDRPDYLLLRRGTGLDSVLDGIAGDVIAAGHVPLFGALPYAPGDQRRLAVSRLLMEAAIARLVKAQVLERPLDTDRRRFAWLGDDWLLAAETRGASAPYTRERTGNHG